MTKKAISIATVQAKYESWLMGLPGVLGTGIGERNGSPCVLILVDHKTPALDEALPEELEGFAVAIQETGGPIQAF